MTSALECLRAFSLFFLKQLSYLPAEAPSVRGGTQMHQSRRSLCPFAVWVSGSSLSGLHPAQFGQPGAWASLGMANTSAASTMRQARNGRIGHLGSGALLEFTDERGVFGRGAQGCEAEVPKECLETVAMLEG